MEAYTPRRGENGACVIVVYIVYPEGGQSTARAV